MAADDRDAEPVGGPGEAVEHAPGVVAVGAHEHVDERERAAAHRAHVGDVGDDRGGAGGERVGGQERRRDRLAADDEVAVAVRDERGVVAVEGEGQAVEQAQVALAGRPGAARTAAAR